MGNITVIEQDVDCLFGDNHKVSVTLDDNDLVRITCSCYSNRKEVLGLIELGKQKEATCIQAMQFYLKVYAEGTMPFTSYNSAYRNTTLANITGLVKASRNSKRGKRANLRNQMNKLKEKESIIARKLREYIAMEIGQLNEYYAILYEEKSNSHTFNIVTTPVGNQRQHWNPVTQTYDPVAKNYISIATRKDGKWYLVPKWESLVEENTGNSRKCDICNVFGGYDHTATKGHKAKARKYAALALQATSAEGMKMIIENQALRETDPENYVTTSLFKYRKNTKKMVGVVLP